MKFPKHTKLDSDLLEDPFVYIRLIGRLLYVTLIRLNLSYSVQKLSQFMDKPKIPHMVVAHRVVQYLKAFIIPNLHYNIKAFSNLDCASFSDTRRSMTGCCVFLGDSLVSQKLKKHRTLSRSSLQLRQSIEQYDLNTHRHPNYYVIIKLQCTLLLTLYIMKEQSILICHLIRENIHSIIKTLNVFINHQVIDLLTKALGS